MSSNSSYEPPLRPGGDAKNLQERLHELLSRIADTLELVKTWPESDGDDASIHVETTSKLIQKIMDIIKAIQRVEGVVKKDEALFQKLKDCQIPLDLLDLMDHSGGLNPEMFSRGLLREALGQLAGLRRRKVALDMLGNMISAGLAKRKELRGAAAAAAKRKRSSTDNENNNDKDEEKSAKRKKSSA